MNEYLLGKFMNGLRRDVIKDSPDTFKEALKHARILEAQEVLLGNGIKTPGKVAAIIDHGPPKEEQVLQLVSSFKDMMQRQQQQHQEQSRELIRQQQAQQKQDREFQERLVQQLTEKSATREVEKPKVETARREFNQFPRPTPMLQTSYEPRMGRRQGNADNRVRFQAAGGPNERSGAPIRGNTGNTGNILKWSPDGAPICAHCNKPGHIRSSCPRRTNPIAPTSPFRPNWDLDKYIPAYSPFRPAGTFDRSNQRNTLATGANTVRPGFGKRISMVGEPLEHNGQTEGKENEIVNPESCAETIATAEKVTVVEGTLKIKEDKINLERLEEEPTPSCGCFPKVKTAEERETPVKMVAIRKAQLKHLTWYR